MPRYLAGHVAGNWTVLSRATKKDMRAARLESPHYGYRVCRCSECDHTQIVHESGLVPTFEAQCKHCGYKTPRPHHRVTGAP